MDFSEEWKTLWPISSVYSPPLLLAGAIAAGDEVGVDSSTQKSKEIGPLVFNASPESLTQFFSSASLSPRLPNPFTRLSLSTFLHASAPSILRSTSSSIASAFGPQVISNENSLFNCIQLLQFPNAHKVFAFYPSGNNCDQVGFLPMSIRDSRLSVQFDGGIEGCLKAGVGGSRSGG